MARIWQEGFEHGWYHNEYFQANGYGDDALIKLVNSVGSNRTRIVGLVTGRNEYSKYAFNFSDTSNTIRKANLQKTLNADYSELYLRGYLQIDCSQLDTSYEHMLMRNNTTKLLGIESSSYILNTTATYNLKVYKNGTYQTVHTFNLNASQWYRVELYLKVNGSTGAYELRIDGTTIYSESGINTGTNNVNNIVIGHFEDNGSFIPDLIFDDIALNDTTGSINNSWCGAGTIVALQPNGVGNYSQWDNSEGRWVAESGTTTTNVTLAGHGLSTNDWVYNYTRGLLRKVTVVDANNFTVSSITGQTDGDIFILYKYDATYTAQSGSTTNVAVLNECNLDVFDLIEHNTTTSGILVYIENNKYYVVYGNYVISESIGTISAGNSVKGFKVHRSTISNHYEAVNHNKPNHQYARIRTSTASDIDTFDMEELVADKSLPSGVTVNAVRHITMAKDLGEGSQLKPIFRIGTTDYEGATKNLINGKQLLYDAIYDVSPATSTQWTQSEVDGLEAGIKKV